MNRNDLIAFEDDLAAEFNAGKITAPLHLAGGNEQALIDIFKDIRPNDWILCSWRSHYHALLKGVPPDQIKAAIMDGRSIALCFPEYGVLSSAIVGGICPIATGLGWAIRERGTGERVHCFVGDMTAMTGTYMESRRYCQGHQLPVTWWIEDNNLSVCTPTGSVWGADLIKADEHRYFYKLNKPHVGTGTWVRF